MTTRDTPPDAASRNGQGFEVSPAALSGAAGVFDAEAEALADVTTGLATRLDTLGSPWGADEVGVRFGESYVPAAKRVLANMNAMTNGLIRIAAALRAVAEAYEATEATMTRPASGLSFRPGAPLGAGSNSTAPASTTAVARPAPASPASPATPIMPTVVPAAGSPKVAQRGAPRIRTAVP